MDLSAENVQAVFTSSLARTAEATPNLRVRGVYNEVYLSLVRLSAHRDDVCGFLGRLSTRFYADRGGGHSYAAMGYRRDGEHWGGRPDVERLVTLGLGLGLVDFCLDRSLWHLFPSALPFLRLSGDLFRLWATFRRRVGAAPEEAVRSLTLSFCPEDHLPPLGVSEGQWYRPMSFEVGDLGEVPTHVAASFYNGVVIDGFFNNSVPSWVLDPDTTLEVY
jgi:hypothetical protein